MFNHPLPQVVLTDLSQIFEAKNAGIVAVGELKIEGIAADDRHAVKRKIIGDAFAAEDLFARPLIDARSARAASSKLRGLELRFGIVRPFDRDEAIRFFDDLCGFD